VQDQSSSRPNVDQQQQKFILCETAQKLLDFFLFTDFDIQISQKTTLRNWLKFSKDTTEMATLGQNIHILVNMIKT